MALTNYPNGMKSFFVNSDAVKKDAAYTVVITTDSGKTFTVDTDVTFTLPAIAIGNNFTFTALKDNVQITISPNASDGITYAGSSTDDKDLILTKATAKKGDSVTLASIDGTVAWQVMNVRGIWVKQA